MRRLILATLLALAPFGAYADFTAKFDVIKDGKVIDTMKRNVPSPTKEACEAALAAEAPTVKMIVAMQIGDHELKGRCDENGQPA